MKKRALILLMMFCISSIYANTENTPIPYRIIVLKLNEAEIDTTTSNVINLDSAQIAYFNRFLSDPLWYYERDSVFHASPDSLNSTIIDIRRIIESGEYSNTKPWVRIMMIVVLVFMTICIVFIILCIRELQYKQEEIDKVIKSNDGLKKRFDSFVNNGSKSASSSIMKTYDIMELKKLQDEISDLKIKVESLGIASQDNRLGLCTVALDQSHVSLRPVGLQKFLYADSIIEGVFSHVLEQENDDTVFLLKLNDETHASISLFERAYNKVLANVSYLEGCENQIIGNNVIEIVQEGEAERGLNGKWKVVVPLKVRME